MPVIGVLAQKGGAGKTTLAIHLAVASGDAALIDTDKQQSAAGWWKEREGDLPELITASPVNVRKAVAAARHQWIIIDTPPHADDALKAVAAVADFIIIPTRPSILDLRAIASTVDMVQGKNAAIVLNACPPPRLIFGEAGLTVEARKALKAYGLPVAPVSITQRVSLSHALTSSQAVTEFEPGGKAATEIMKLWEWIRGKA